MLKECEGIPQLKRVVVAFGTRPEAIKMAPVILALRQNPLLEVNVLSTGQQRQQVEDGLKIFGVVPDDDLQVMTERQTLPGLMGKIVPAAADKLPGSVTLSVNVAFAAPQAAATSAVTLPVELTAMFEIVTPLTVALAALLTFTTKLLFASSISLTAARPPRTAR